MIGSDVAFLCFFFLLFLLFGGLFSGYLFIVLFRRHSLCNGSSLFLFFLGFLGATSLLCILVCIAKWAGLPRLLGMIKKALHARVIGTVCLIIGLHLACWLLLALLNLFLDLGTSLLANFMGLRGICKLGEGARAFAGRHVLSILELRGDAGAHVSYLFLFLLSVDGLFHQLGHLGLELLRLFTSHNFSLLQGNNTLSDAINSCRRFHFLAHTGFLTIRCPSSDLKLHFFVCLCLRESQVVL